MEDIKPYCLIVSVKNKQKRPDSIKNLVGWCLFVFSKKYVIGVNTKFVSTKRETSFVYVLVSEIVQIFRLFSIAEW